MGGNEKQDGKGSIDVASSQIGVSKISALSGTQNLKFEASCFRFKKEPFVDARALGSETHFVVE